MLRTQSDRDDMRVLVTVASVLDGEDLKRLAVILGGNHYSAEGAEQVLRNAGIDASTRIIGATLGRHLFDVSRRARSDGAGLATPGGQVMLAAGFAKVQSFWDSIAFWSNADALLDEEEFKKLGGELGSTLDDVGPLIDMYYPNVRYTEALAPSRSMGSMGAGGSGPIQPLSGLERIIAGAVRLAGKIIK